MNFAEIENMWRSPLNRPSPAQLEEQRMQFINDLNKRHRGFVLFMSVVGAALVFITGKIIVHLIWPSPAVDTIALTREWGVFPLLALPWIGWILMVRQYRWHRALHPNYETSISSSVRALLDENRLERTRYKIIAGLQLLTVILMPLIVYQLRAVGKAGDEILVPAFVIFPLIILAIFVWSTVRYRRKLLPRKRELETLLASYQ